MILNTIKGVYIKGMSFKFIPDKELYFHLILREKKWNFSGGVDVDTNNMDAILNIQHDVTNIDPNSLLTVTIECEDIRLYIRYNSRM